jgi:hypothetical protein
MNRRIISNLAVRTMAYRYCAMLPVIKVFSGLWKRVLAVARNASMRGVGTKMGTHSWGEIRLRRRDDLLESRPVCPELRCYVSRSQHSDCRSICCMPASFVGSLKSRPIDSDGAYVLDTSAGAALGINSRPAKPGDLIIAYGIGFGDVTPSILPGVIVG